MTKNQSDLMEKKFVFREFYQYWTHRMEMENNKRNIEIIRAILTKEMTDMAFNSEFDRLSFNFEFLNNRTKWLDAMNVCEQILVWAINI